MNVLSNLEELRGDPARDFMWSFHDEIYSVDFEELDDEEKKFNKNLLDAVIESENIRDFTERIQGMAQSYEQIDSDKKEDFQEYAEDRITSAIQYDAETVELFHDVADHSWSEVHDRLNSDAELDAQEAMYKNRMASWANELNPRQLSETMIEHYMKEKRNDPDRAESFEQASKKLLGNLGWGEYQETLDEVEMLTDEDGERYINELERLVEENRSDNSVVEKGVYSEIESLLRDADNHVELAAYTETCIDYMRREDPRKAEIMEEKVQELYEQALPTEPLH